MDVKTTSCEAMGYGTVLLDHLSREVTFRVATYSGVRHKDSGVQSWSCDGSIHQFLQVNGNGNAADYYYLGGEGAVGE